MRYLTRVNETAPRFTQQDVAAAGVNITGTEGDDRITPFEPDDGPNTGIGNDTVDALGGSDYVDGSDGDDLVWGRAGEDTLIGGVGNDTLGGGDDADWIDGGEGNDTLYGAGTGLDTLFGGAGNDNLAGSYGYVGDSGKTLHGGEGKDTLEGQLEDQIFGDAGDDTLVFHGAGGTVDGGNDNDTLTIDSYFDSQQTSRALLVLGGAGDDLVLRRSSDEADVAVDLGAGNDTFDSTFAGEKGWAIVGGEGDDKFILSSYGDTIDAGSGNDTVQLQAGYADATATATLGEGIDRVVPVYTSYSHGLLTVTDFAAGAGGDQLDLSVVNKQCGLTKSADSIGKGYVRLTASGDDTIVEVDQTGPKDGSHFVSVVVLKGVHPSQLTADNFAQAVTLHWGDNASAPVVDGDRTVVIAEDATTALNLTAPIDPDGGSVSIAIGQLPDYGYLTLGNGTLVTEGQSLTAVQLESLVYHPPVPDWNGTPESFSYLVTDEEGSVRVAMIGLTVAPVPDSPVLDLPDGGVWFADTGRTEFSFDLSRCVTDPDRQTAFTYELTLADGSPVPSWLHIDPATGLLSGKAPYGTESFDVTVKVTDADGLNDSATLHLVAHGAELYGGADNDKLSGSSHDDYISGNEGNDRLDGRAGGDWLAGGAGDDRLRGGSGDDGLAGGAGADVFVLEASAKSNGFDRMVDFDMGKHGDVIDARAFLGDAGAKILDGQPGSGDSLDSFLAPVNLQGQNIFAIEGHLSGMTPTALEIADLLDGFTAEGGTHQVVMVRDADTGRGYIVFANERANDGNDAFDVKELSVVAEVQPANGGDVDGLVAANFKVPSTQAASDVSHGINVEAIMTTHWPTWDHASLDTALM